MRTFHVYILSSRSGVLYIGITNDLERRVQEHKLGLCDGFTKQYRVDRLVYYEEFTNVNDAIAREKQVKAWRREKKVWLIERENPRWQDLSQDWSDTPPRDLSTPLRSARDDSATVSRQGEPNDSANERISPTVAPSERNSPAVTRSGRSSHTVIPSERSESRDLGSASV